MLGITKFQNACSNNYKHYAIATIVALALIILSTQNLQCDHFTGIGAMGSTMCLAAGGVMILAMVIHSLLHALLPKQKKVTVEVINGFYKVTKEEAEKVKKALIEWVYFPHITEKNGYTFEYLDYGYEGRVESAPVKIVDEHKKDPSNNYVIPQEMVEEILKEDPPNGYVRPDQVDQYGPLLRNGEYMAYLPENSDVCKYKFKIDNKVYDEGTQAAYHLCHSKILAIRFKLSQQRA